jgi:hypothetical protein
MKFRHLAPAILSVLALVGLASCGGGGGGSTSTVQAAGAGGSTSQPSPSTDTTGVVAIFLKDDPTDKYTRIVMHLTGVDLLGADGKYTISDEEKQIDLLKLQNFYDMLAVSDKVPAGTYEKIRMYVQSIKLYYLDENDEETYEEAEVPANGKVDLNPRGEFTVSPDTAIMIEIDIDARNSIKIHETGNGRTKFRPQVFVHIEEKEIIETLIRVSGTVGGEISTDPKHFDLCDIDVELQTDTDGCVQVNVGDDTRIFDEEGEPLEFSLLSSGDDVTVWGTAIIIDEEEMTEGDTVQMIQINAIVIQREPDPENPEPVLVSLNGSVLTPVNDEDTFGFQVFPGQDYPTEAISAILHPDTRILNAKSLTELTPADILPGRLGQVIGASTNSDPQTVKAALVLLKLDEAQPKSLNGVVGEVRDDGFDLEIDNEGTPVERCVAPTPGASYFVLISTDDGVKVIKADADAVKSGLGAAVFGEESGTDCFDANLIVLQEVPEVTPT